MILRTNTYVLLWL